MLKRLIKRFFTSKEKCENCRYAIEDAHGNFDCQWPRCQY